MYTIEINENALLNQIESDVLDAQIEVGLNNGIQRAVDHLKTIVYNATPYDYGRARGSIHTEIHGTPADIIEGKVFSNELDYMLTLEEGRRPGATMPPLEPIATWLQRKGVDPAMAYVVARAIGRRGLPAHHMFKDAAEQHGKEVQQIMIDALLEVLG